MNKCLTLSLKDTIAACDPLSGPTMTPVNDTIMASYRFVFGTITAPVKDTITASYQFHGAITAPEKDTITASCPLS